MLARNVNVILAKPFSYLNILLRRYYYITIVFIVVQATIRMVYYYLHYSPYFNTEIQGRAKKSSNILTGRIISQ